jgi:hypothetical protein
MYLDFGNALYTVNCEQKSGNTIVDFGMLSSVINK